MFWLRLVPFTYMQLTFICVLCVSISLRRSSIQLKICEREKNVVYAVRQTQGETKAILQPDDVIIISHSQSKREQKMCYCQLFITHMHLSFNEERISIMQMN